MFRVFASKSSQLTKISPLKLLAGHGRRGQWEPTDQLKAFSLARGLKVLQIGCGMKAAHFGPIQVLKFE